MCDDETFSSYFRPLRSDEKILSGTSKKSLVNKLLIMGNVNEKRSIFYDKLYETREAKAHQILLWYLQERFRDGSSVTEFTIISSSIFKSCKLIKNGRSIGTAGISKILKNIQPIILINKINPIMALLLSIISSSIENISENFKDYNACQNLSKVIKKIIDKIRFAKKLSSDLMKILNEIQAQLALIGRRFEMNPKFVNVKNLKIWADWATLHWITLVICYFQEGVKITDEENLKTISMQYQQDFQQLCIVLSRNAKFEFLFREENFLTYPMENEKRWWLEAKVKLTENDFWDSGTFWESEEHLIGQVCLTRGHQSKSQDYIPGLVKNPEFLNIWSCVYPDTCDGRCIKCILVQNILRQLRNNFDEIFETPLEEWFEGCSKFKLLQM